MTQQSVSRTINLRPLDSRLLSFHEYDGSRLQGAQQDLLRARIWTGDPAMEAVEGATFVPAAVRRSIRAGIVGRDGLPIASAHLQPSTQRNTGLAEPRVVLPQVEIDEEVVYLGWLFDNYGHFLLQSLARIWALPVMDRSVRLVFHYRRPAQWIPKNWMESILAAFGIPMEQILVPTVPTRFRRIIIPEPLYEMGRMVHEQAAAPYHAVAAGIVSPIKASTASTQPVYLSRRLLTSSRRPIVGEAELEDVLRENGFLVAHLETMTFADQVRLVNSHAHIFSSTCSAAHNMVFALHKPRLHLMASGEATYLSYMLCSAMVGVPTAFIRCFDTGDRVLGGNPRWMPEIVTMANVVDYLDGIGLLKSRGRAALAGRDPALRREYEEAWLYASIVADLRGAAPLSEAVESEAVRFASSSWPVSLALARYYARRHIAQIDAIICQFADLAETEFDINRLARYQTDVEKSFATLAKRCQPATASRLAEVALDRFSANLGSPPQVSGCSCRNPNAAVDRPNTSNP